MRLTVGRARALLLALALALALTQMLAAWQGGQPATEVFGAALFVVVLPAALYLGTAGALVSGGIASLLYVAALSADVAPLGVGSFVALASAHVVAYMGLAILLAMGSRSIEHRLVKLDRIDPIDDLTGLFNAGFFLSETAHELERSHRYGTTFSVVAARLPKRKLPVRRRARSEVLAEVARTVAAKVRTVDRVVRLDEPNAETLLIVLPETPEEGASVLAGRIVQVAGDVLKEHASPGVPIETETVTLPNEEHAFAAIREAAARADAERRMVKGT